MTDKKETKILKYVEEINRYIIQELINENTTLHGQQLLNDHHHNMLLFKYYMMKKTYPNKYWKIHNRCQSLMGS